MPTKIHNELRTVDFIAQIYRETIARITLYDSRVAAGLDLQAALSFAQYVLWSGIPQLCEFYARQKPKIDGSFLRWRAEELQRAIRQYWNNPAHGKTVEVSRFESVQHKLDIIAAHIAGLR